MQRTPQGAYLGKSFKEVVATLSQEPRAFCFGVRRVRLADSASQDAMISLRGVFMSRGYPRPHGRRQDALVRGLEIESSGREPCPHLYSNVLGFGA